MIKKTNNKGMTLVEIVVVLLIASIIMTIVCAIALACSMLLPNVEEK